MARWAFGYIIKRPTGSEFNPPVELRVKAPFDIDVLRRALQSLIDHHEMLRTTFHQDGEHLFGAFCQAK
ncbi:condensation domain-containing protein [Mesorhizobium sp.]|uniref:condensation domain-containing protein n=1 Tax=Mesorhizobium sp. TaxID=1871066 RepID=UPI0026338825|nr:condensation domain-containing protein [Mesorhizobium sp.]